MEDNREFVAFSRKLLRDFIQIKKLMEKGEYEKVKSMIDELIDCLLYTSPFLSFDFPEKKMQAFCWSTVCLVRLVF